MSIKVIFGLTMVKKHLVKVLYNSFFAYLEGKNQKIIFGQNLQILVIVATPPYTKDEYHAYHIVVHT